MAREWITPPQELIDILRSIDCVEDFGILRDWLEERGATDKTLHYIGNRFLFAALGEHGYYLDGIEEMLMEVYRRTKWLELQCGI